MICGQYFYLYLTVDIWSRKVMHADNGGLMKGATLKATMENLGVIASYSCPRVSDDNPCSEALFRTVKYRPE